MSIFEGIGKEAGEHLGESLAEGLKQLLSGKRIHIEVGIVKPAATTAETTSIVADVRLEHDPNAAI